MLVAIITVSFEREYAYCLGRWFINNRRASWNLARSRCNVGLSTLIRVHGIRVRCAPRNEGGSSAKMSWKLKMNPHVFYLLGFPDSLLPPSPLFLFLSRAQLRETLPFLAYVYIFLPHLRGETFFTVNFEEKGQKCNKDDSI